MCAVNGVRDEFSDGFVLGGGLMIRSDGGQQNLQARCCASCGSVWHGHGARMLSPLRNSVLDGASALALRGFDMLVLDRG